jgi:cellobiose phosphorylase
MNRVPMGFFKKKDVKMTGYFNANATAYTITEMRTLRPLFNFLWNEELLCYFDQYGRGASTYRAPDGAMQTLTDEGENRLLFLRDRTTGQYWAANRNFDNEPFDRFQTTVGTGASTILSAYRGIECEFVFFIPAQGPREGWRVTVANRDDRPRAISLFAYAASEIGRICFQGANSSRYDPDCRAVIQTNPVLDKPCPLHTAYFAADRAPDAYETSAKRFRGLYGHIAHPDSVQAGRLASQDHIFDVELAGVLQFDLDLQPGETATIRFFNGLAETPAAARADIRTHLTAAGFDADWAAACEAFEPVRNRILVETPDAEVNAFANVWLKRQFRLGQGWGRAGGLGFRDVMQDSRAGLLVDPAYSRRVLVGLLSRQLPTGGAPMSWPEGDETHWRDVRDQPSWIPDTVIGYVKETGDLGFLDEVIPYNRSDERGTVLDHIRRGLRFLFARRGDHGLCLWGGGDWNDGMNLAGSANRGESVWLTQATVRAARQFAELLDHLGQHEEALLIREHAATLTAALQAHAWDTDHFICGYNDKGEKIGSYANEEGRLFLNMQTWAVLSETAKDPGALMDVVEAHLKCPYGYVLNTPSYTKADAGIGRITSFEPGSYENGSVYCHGVTFKIAADCVVGRPDRALETMKLLFPSNAANPAFPCHVEPYAITNMYLGPQNLRAGQSIYGWATGSAGWLFRIIVEDLLGVRADYDGLRIRPCLPSEWTRVAIQREFRGRRYNIAIANPHRIAGGQARLVLDGRPIEGDCLPAPAGPGESAVEVTVTS